MVALVRQAARRGARLIVTPEYGLALRQPAADPAVGDRPAADVTLAPDSPLVVFGALATELQVYLVLALRTAAPDPEGGQDVFNTQIAYGPDGRVLAKHHKIVLFARERLRLTAGEEPAVFDTPFGRVGLLICADLYGDPQMHDQLVNGQSATIVAISAQWTVERAAHWQAAFARDWGVHVVAANSAWDDGRGGGIFDPRGRSLAVHHSARPGIAFASIAMAHQEER
jgi:predicted amidohydrolase